MRDCLTIYVNGRPVEVRGEDVFLTLSDFLRLNCRLTGTKVVCAEGDCGACAAFVGRPRGETIQYSAVDSCIQLMCQLDATHIITIEGLSEAGKLNPIQQSMVDCHGAQCGFCTPGFVVSLYDILRDGKPVDASTIRRGLTGNLCRCTGYDSIIRGALKTDRAALAGLEKLYPPEKIIESLKAASEQGIQIVAGSHKFFKPTSLIEALQFRAENPDCTIIAGATDLGVQLNKRTRTIQTVLSLGTLAELRSITIASTGLRVGAAATLTELQAAAQKNLPELARFLEWFGSPLIRNAGTLAGNIVNGSPIADTVPALFVLNATVELASTSGLRQVDINRFYTGYRKTVLEPGELVTAVAIPIPADDEDFRLYKLSKRKDLDISSFGAAIWVRRTGRRIDDVRIAYGGVAPTVIRMSRTEAILRGSEISLELFERAADTARAEVSPISDVRGSEGYRRALAGNILLKFWNDLGGDESEAHAPPPSGGVFQPALARDPRGNP